MGSYDFLGSESPNASFTNATYRCGNGNTKKLRNELKVTWQNWIVSHNSDEVAEGLKAYTSNQ